MNYTDEVLQKYASFWDKHKTALLAGGAGALLSGIAGYNMAGTNPYDTPEEQLKKRIYTALAAGTLGGIGAGGIAHFAKTTGVSDAISNGVDKIIGNDTDENSAAENKPQVENKSFTDKALDTIEDNATMGLFGAGAGSVIGASMNTKNIDKRLSEQYKSMHTLHKDLSDRLTSAENNQRDLDTATSEVSRLNSELAAAPTKHQNDVQALDNKFDAYEQRLQDKLNQNKINKSTYDARIQALKRGRAKRMANMVDAYQNQIASLNSELGTQNDLINALKTKALDGNGFNQEIKQLRKQQHASQHNLNRVTRRMNRGPIRKFMGAAGRGAARGAAIGSIMSILADNAAGLFADHMD